METDNVQDGIGEFRYNIYLKCRISVFPRVEVITEVQDRYVPKGLTYISEAQDT